jgi:hypothetical protein
LRYLVGIFLIENRRFGLDADRGEFLKHAMEALLCGVAARRASRPPRHTTATSAMAASPVRRDMNGIQSGAEPFGQFNGVVVSLTESH